MKARMLLTAALLMACSVAVHAAQAPKAKAPAKEMDPQAAMEMMEKLAAPGPNHQILAKMAGEWNLSVKYSMDPTQPTQEAKSIATISTIMDGRYCQEQAVGEMMGKPFNGMGLTGYDNIAKKYVGTWIDNFGTGIMTSEGTMDGTGKVINWKGKATDPMTGKVAMYRMVTRFADDNHMNYEMYGPGPTGKEYKMMEIAYERKM